jgi:hypothetical protein
MYPRLVKEETCMSGQQHQLGGVQLSHLEIDVMTEYPNHDCGEFDRCILNQ